jgi:hypothetical protein
VHHSPLFSQAVSAFFAAESKALMDQDGFHVLPGVLTSETCDQIRAASERIASISRSSPTDTVDEGGFRPELSCAEHDRYLEGMIGHPQMLELARYVLGSREIHFDHMVSLVKRGGHPGQGWHTHEYAAGMQQDTAHLEPGDQQHTFHGTTSPNDPTLELVRIFFYVDGFAAGDGSLRAVRGSHLHYATEMDLSSRGSLNKSWTEDDFAKWLSERDHLVTGAKLLTEDIQCPAGSVVLMFTHTAHAVSPRHAASGPRHGIVAAYRNPGAPSMSRFMSRAFVNKITPGLEGLKELGLAGKAKLTLDLCELADAAFQENQKIHPACADCEGAAIAAVHQVVDKEVAKLLPLGIPRAAIDMPNGRDERQNTIIPTGWFTKLLRVMGRSIKGGEYETIGTELMDMKLITACCCRIEGMRWVTNEALMRWVKAVVAPKSVV